MENQNSGKGLWIAIIVVIILIIAVVAWRLIGSDTTVTPVETNSTSTPGTQLGTSTEAVNPNAPKTVTVKLLNTGYEPQSLTINNGDTVTFVNESDGKMWTASAPHPKHTDYPEFDQKTAANNGGTYSFTFTKNGTWKYHNHLNPAQFGSVTVVSNGINKD
jgi:plastocyanin